MRGSRYIDSGKAEDLALPVRGLCGVELGSTRRGSMYEAISHVILILEVSYIHLDGSQSSIVTSCNRGMRNHTQWLIATLVGRCGALNRHTDVV